MYYKSKFLLKKYLRILCLIICLFIPKVGSSANSIVNFLPMEDALSTSRTAPCLENADVKPYREIVEFKNKSKEKINIGSVDIYAFILLGIVFLLISRRNTKSRKINL